MKNGTDIKQLLQMTIGQIDALRKAQMNIQDVIDTQGLAISSIIETEKIEDDWAEDFINDLNKKTEE